MTLFVDTSLWSLALRRDAPAPVAEVRALERALADGELLVTTGLVYQELLQGFHYPRDQDAIVARFGALPFLTPDRHDHFEAAQLRNRARRRGLQVGTIDAILAQLCIRHELRLLTTNPDFTRIAERVRPGEIRALDIGDVQERKDVPGLRIGRAVKGPNANAPIRGTKTGETGWIPIDEELADWLDWPAPSPRRLRTVKRAPPHPRGAPCSCTGWAR